MQASAMSGRSEQERPQKVRTIVVEDRYASSTEAAHVLESAPIIDTESLLTTRIQASAYASLAYPTVSLPKFEALLHLARAYLVSQLPEQALRVLAQAHSTLIDLNSPSNASSAASVPTAPASTPRHSVSTTSLSSSASSATIGPELSSTPSATALETASHGLLWLKGATHVVALDAAVKQVAQERSKRDNSSNVKGNKGGSAPPSPTSSSSSSSSSSPQGSSAMAAAQKHARDGRHALQSLAAQLLRPRFHNSDGSSSTDTTTGNSTSNNTTDSSTSRWQRELSWWRSLPFLDPDRPDSFLQPSKCAPQQQPQPQGQGQAQGASGGSGPSLGSATSVLDHDGVPASLAQGLKQGAPAPPPLLLSTLLHLAALHALCGPSGAKPAVEVYSAIQTLVLRLYDVPDVVTLAKAGPLSAALTSAGLLSGDHAYDSGDSTSSGPSAGSQAFSALLLSSLGLAKAFWAQAQLAKKEQDQQHRAQGSSAPLSGPIPAPPYVQRAAQTILYASAFLRLVSCRPVLARAVLRVVDVVAVVEDGVFSATTLPMANTSTGVSAEQAQSSTPSAHESSSSAASRRDSAVQVLRWHQQAASAAAANRRAFRSLNASSTDVSLARAVLDALALAARACKALADCVAATTTNPAYGVPVQAAPGDSNSNTEDPEDAPALCPCLPSSTWTDGTVPKSELLYVLLSQALGLWGLYWAGLQVLVAELVAPQLLVPADVARQRAQAASKSLSGFSSFRKQSIGSAADSTGADAATPGQWFRGLVRTDVGSYVVGPAGVPFPVPSAPVVVIDVASLPALLAALPGMAAPGGGQALRCPDALTSALVAAPVAWANFDVLELGTPSYATAVSAIVAGAATHFQSSPRPHALPLVANAATPLRTLGQLLDDMHVQTGVAQLAMCDLFLVLARGHLALAAAQHLLAHATAAAACPIAAPVGHALITLGRVCAQLGRRQQAQTAYADACFTLRLTMGPHSKPFQDARAALESLIGADAAAAEIGAMSTGSAAPSRSSSPQGGAVGATPVRLRRTTTTGAAAASTSATPRRRRPSSASTIGPRPPWTPYTKPTPAEQAAANNYGLENNNSSNSPARPQSQRRRPSSAHAASASAESSDSSKENMPKHAPGLAASMTGSSKSRKPQAPQRPVVKPEPKSAQPKKQSTPVSSPKAAAPVSHPPKKTEQPMPEPVAVPAPSPVASPRAKSPVPEPTPEQDRPSEPSPVAPAAASPEPVVPTPVPAAVTDAVPAYGVNFAAMDAAVASDVFEDAYPAPATESVAPITTLPAAPVKSDPAPVAEPAPSESQAYTDSFEDVAASTAATAEPAPAPEPAEEPNPEPTAVAEPEPAVFVAPATQGAEKEPDMFVNPMAEIVIGDVAFSPPPFTASTGANDAGQPTPALEIPIGAHEADVFVDDAAEVLPDTSNTVKAAVPSTSEAPAASAPEVETDGEVEVFLDDDPGLASTLAFEPVSVPGADVNPTLDAPPVDGDADGSFEVFSNDPEPTPATTAASFGGTGPGDAPVQLDKLATLDFAGGVELDGMSLDDF